MINFRIAMKLKKNLPTKLTSTYCSRTKSVDSWARWSFRRSTAQKSTPIKPYHWTTPCTTSFEQRRDKAIMYCSGKSRIRARNFHENCILHFRQHYNGANKIDEGKLAWMQTGFSEPPGEANNGNCSSTIRQQRISLKGPIYLQAVQKISVERGYSRWEIKAKFM